MQVTKYDSLDSFDLPGYTLLFKYRKNMSKRKSGGLAVSYRTHFSNYISVLDTDNKLIICFKISNQLTKQADILCGVVFIPPEYSPYSVKNPFSEIEQELGQFQTFIQ